MYPENEDREEPLPKERDRLSPTENPLRAENPLCPQGLLARASPPWGKTAEKGKNKRSMLTRKDTP